jgi:hypothetical protein
MAKKKSTAQKAAKAIDKARGNVTYSFSGGDPKKFGSMNTISGAENKKKITRARKAGAEVYVSRGKNLLGGASEYQSAKKTDVAASNKKTLKASGVGFKATARQVKLERERTATRATAMANKAKKAKKK